MTASRGRGYVRFHVSRSLLVRLHSRKLLEGRQIQDLVEEALRAYLAEELREGASLTASVALLNRAPPPEAFRAASGGAE